MFVNVSLEKGGMIQWELDDSSVEEHMLMLSMDEAKGPIPQHHNNNKTKVVLMTDSRCMSDIPDQKGYNLDSFKR